MYIKNNKKVNKRKAQMKHYEKNKSPSKIPFTLFSISHILMDMGPGLKIL